MGRWKFIVLLVVVLLLVWVGLHRKPQEGVPPGAPPSATPPSASNPTDAQSAVDSLSALSADFTTRLNAAADAQTKFGSIYTQGAALGGQLK